MQVGIGLLLPLLAGVVPVLNGTRITTRKALTDTGMVANVQGQGLTERLLARIQRIKPVHRPFLLSVRNTMRHKGRLAQTLFVLIVGTALFISVLSVNSSVDATLEGFMRHHQYDVSMAMARPYRIDQMERTALELSSVESVESWTIDGATRLRADDSESDPFQVYAVPPDTVLIDPQMENGRWLDSTIGNGFVVNSDVLDKEPDISVGDEIRIDISGRELNGPVIGIIRTDSQGPAIYMALDDYAYLTRTVGQATHLQVIATSGDPAAQDALKGQLFQHLEAAGFEVSGTQTAQQINTSNELMFTIIVAVLILMALLLAAVGGLGLTTTMSINMLERIREIGVLRAIGASNLSVRKIVLAEGLVIGALSWGIGVLFSLPVSAFLSDQIGLALLKVPLSYQYSLMAAVVWFFALMLIAVAASLGPARDAVRLTIREVLAYE
jgi:putative ABC transport system permease protein